MREWNEFRIGRGTAAALFVATIMAVRLAVAAPTVAGDWQGSLATGGGSLRVVVHLSQDKDGAIKGTMDSPDQGAAGIAITSASYAKPALQFAISTIGASYEGKLDGEKKEIVGVWKQGTASLPLTFSPVKK